MVVVYIFFLPCRGLGVSGTLSGLWNSTPRFEQFVVSKAPSEGLLRALSGPLQRDRRQCSCDTPLYRDTFQVLEATWSAAPPLRAEKGCHRAFFRGCSAIFLRHPSKPQGPLNGGVSNGGVSRSGLVLPFLFFFVLFGTFPICSGIFPVCSGMVRGFSRFVLFLFLGLLRAPTRNSPERVRDTIWTFPKKSGKPLGLETPRFSFSQKPMKT